MNEIKCEGCGKIIYPTSSSTTNVNDMHSYKTEGDNDSSFCRQFVVDSGKFWHASCYFTYKPDKEHLLFPELFRLHKGDLTLV